MATERTPEETADLICRYVGCILLIGPNNHFCDHHAEVIRKLRDRAPRRTALRVEGVREARG